MSVFRPDTPRHSCIKSLKRHLVVTFEIIVMSGSQQNFIMQHLSKTETATNMQYKQPTS